MKKLKLLTLLLIFLPFFANAQSLDCPSKLGYFKPSKNYNFNNLSKSAQCYTGKKYEFMVPLMKGKDYRFTFFASPIFNNKINFRIIDTGSGEKVLDLPGEVTDATKGSCVLREYYDKGLNKMVHPFFDFQPNSSTTLKIIIDIESKEQKPGAEGGYDAPEEREKGCITVFIQDRASDNIGF